MKDYYAILEIEITATGEEIKKAYRRLALLYHPDRNKEKGAVDKFKEITSAYEVLKDENKKQVYDQQRNIFDRTPVGFPQGMRVTYTNHQQGGYTMTIIHTAEGVEVWINGVRQQ